ncbi:AbfB domain-containing protein [Solwaraspora sp. WMMD792]|uniref:AbfB domain-containing protein n=1 Tax=Solwaraspora sp. WMMD792 TaxID=3016099 RepID=UPI0024161538|nr:AbfB domain-containing protein [Solwaraspora sp. WMMD792]MDG4770729.1 AbfB domain-containing protein [Solwaraspora sp. WMMD792]
MHTGSAFVLATLVCAGLPVVTGDAVAGGGDTRSMAAAASLPSGAASLESVNYPGRFLRHQDQGVRLDPVGTSSPQQTRLDTTFVIVNGLASPDCYSLQKRLADGIRGTGHHSVVSAPDRDTWHIAYHRFAVPAGNGTNREVVIDPMEFAADGTIRPIVPSR